MNSESASAFTLEAVDHFQGFRLLRTIKAWPPSLATTVLIGLMAIVGLVDYLTGLELSVSLLYLIPIALGVWTGGRATGYTVALASAAVWFAADWLGRQSYGHWYLPVWNTMALTVSFLVVAALLASLCEVNENLERAVAHRTRALQDEIAQRCRAEGELNQALREVREAHAELQRTQFQLIESAKMESVARLAAGVAHEVKNPLMTLSLGADYFLARKLDNDDETQLAQDMKEAVKRASSVINILLDYSRIRPPQLSLDNLSLAVENSLILVRHELNRQRITVIREFAPDLPLVQLDRARIEHLFVNLFINALQAMSPGGTLTIRAFASDIVEDAADQAVTVELDDTGHGINPQNAEKLFEPFFTTKPPGQGTGLGLAIVRRIMEIHGGTVRLTNRPDGRGARVTLQFHSKFEGK
ncbi:hypothetical protein GC207_03155 [bacterium]|nr:hypothetical protein [bacterium]